MANSHVLPSAPIKPLSDSNPLKFVPPEFDLRNSTRSIGEKEDQQFPIIDLSVLENGTPEQRAQVAGDINSAIEDWSFFMVVNHGVPEKVAETMIEMVREFFNLTEEEKSKCVGKGDLDQMWYGTSFNPGVEDVRYWRDFLKLPLQPNNIVSPSNPHGFREALIEYTSRIREVARVLMRALSANVLGLDQGFMEKAMELDSGVQYLVANYYPPCPQPELAMGLPPHTDVGFLTVLLQDAIGGLQVKHRDKWIDVRPVPGSLLINLGDQMEILSNGKYKSVVHRVTLKNKSTRISVAVLQAPSFESTVKPAAEFIGDGGKQNFGDIHFREYLKFKQRSPINEKSDLEQLKLPE